MVRAVLEKELRELIMSDVMQDYVDSQPLPARWNKAVHWVNELEAEYGDRPYIIANRISSVLAELRPTAEERSFLAKYLASLKPRITIYDPLDYAMPVKPQR